MTIYEFIILNFINDVIELGKTDIEQARKEWKIYLKVLKSQ